MINIIESKILGKNKNQALCEDGMVITDDFIAVIDGATSPFSLVNDKRTGLVAMETIAEATRKLPFNADSFTCIKLLNSALNEKQKHFDYILKNEKDKRLCANIVLFSIYRNEIWTYGDCPYMVNGKLFSLDKPIDIITANARSAFLESELSKGKTIEELLINDTGAQYIYPLIERQAEFANTDQQYGYPVLDGYDIIEKFITVQNVFFNDEVVLATDGYPFLKSTLSESEKELERLKSIDPLCIKEYKSTKGFYYNQNSYDDRTYIRFVVKN